MMNTKRTLLAVFVVLTVCCSFSVQAQLFQKNYMIDPAQPQTVNRSYATKVVTNLMQDIGPLVTVGTYFGDYYGGQRDINLTRLDTNTGTVMYTGMLVGPNTNPGAMEANAFDYCQLDEGHGDLVITGYNHSMYTDCDNLLLISTDPLGNVYWSMEYFFGMPSYGLDVVYDTEYKNMVVVGFIGDSSANAYKQAVIMSVDRYTGAVNWVNSYSGSKSTTNYYDIATNIIREETAAGFIVTGTASRNNTPYDIKATILSIDAYGGLNWYNMFDVGPQYPRDMLSSDVIQVSSGEILAMTCYNDFGYILTGFNVTTGAEISSRAFTQFYSDNPDTYMIPLGYSMQFDAGTGLLYVSGVGSSIGGDDLLHPFIATHDRNSFIPYDMLPRRAIHLNIADSDYKRYNRGGFYTMFRGGPGSIVNPYIYTPDNLAYDGQRLFMVNSIDVDGGHDMHVTKAVAELTLHSCDVSYINTHQDFVFDMTEYTGLNYYPSSPELFDSEITLMETSVNESCYCERRPVSGTGQRAAARKASPSKTQSSLSKAFPNPFSEELKFTFVPAYASQVDIVLIDMLGKEVYHESRYVQEGSQEISLALGHLHTGVYTIRIKSSQGEEFNTKVVKK